jgi:hypothetical protein
MMGSRGRNKKVLSASPSRRQPGDVVPWLNSSSQLAVCHSIVASQTRQDLRHPAAIVPYITLSSVP